METRGAASGALPAPRGGSVPAARQKALPAGSCSSGVPRACPRPGVSPAAMEPREVLEALVAVVATLGELMATVAGLDVDILLLAVSPWALHLALQAFTWQLHDTLCHPGVLSLCYRRVISLNHGRVTALGRALAALEATPGVTWAHVTRAASDWRDSVAALEESWARLAGEATKLRDAFREAATAEARGEVVLATGQAWESTWTGQRAEVALGLLERLVAACDRAMAFPLELQRRLGDIEAALEGTREVSLDFRVALVGVVAEAERLWEASAHLATRHLLGTLGDIHALFWSFHCDPGGPGARAVAEQCQRAIEDIPRLLQEQ